MQDDKFDLIVEWALIHCMPKESHEKYASLLEGLTSPNALLIQRSFSKRDPSCKNGESKSHLKGINYHFDRDDIKKLYEDWQIIDYQKEDIGGKYFDQYLMQKKTGFV